MRLHLPPNLPSESMILFVFSTWHVLLALLVARTGANRQVAQEASVAALAGGEVQA